MVIVIDEFGDCDAAQPPPGEASDGQNGLDGSSCAGDPPSKSVTCAPPSVHAGDAQVSKDESKAGLEDDSVRPAPGRVAPDDAVE